MTRGPLIALEGIDGSGTTTQAERLQTHLTATGHRAHLTLEPSTGPVGKLIRRVLIAEEKLDDASLALLFAADRLDHWRREIEPACRGGMVVITDRHLLSSLAYQSLDLPRSWVESINQRATAPDLTLFLRVSPNTAAERRAKRGGPTERFDGQSTQERVAASYEAAMSSPLMGPTEVIDGDVGPQGVAEALAEHVGRFLAQWPAPAAPRGSDHQ